MLCPDWKSLYVVGSAEYSRCEGYAVYLVGSGRCCLLWAAETERNHHWGTVSNAINAFESSTARKRPQYEQRHEKVILQDDNARPHGDKPVKTYLETLKWEVLPHPPYSPDIAQSYYYLNGFQALLERWAKVVANNGQYFRMDINWIYIRLCMICRSIVATISKRYHFG